jgi:hypothetical protein
VKTLRIYSVIEVAGYIWQPDTGVCTQDIIVKPSEVRHLRNGRGRITRRSVERWLKNHAGDFQKIIAFHANIEDGGRTIDIPWTD